jgi:hypothetical protein
MGWLDNLWRRRQDQATETPEDTARARKSDKPADEDVADELEEQAFQNRNEEIFREPRIPPGTG